MTIFDIITNYHHCEYIDYYDYDYDFNYKYICDYNCN